VFLKSPSHILVYKETNPGLRLPPEPVVTRFGTWIGACNFNAEHFEELKNVRLMNKVYKLN